MDDALLNILVIIAICALVLAIAAGLIKRMDRFRSHLTYLNDEINRTTGEEREYYIRKKKKLWKRFFGFK